MIVRVDVVVKLVIFVVLFAAELTVEIGLQVLQGLGDGFLLLSIVLQREKERQRESERDYKVALYKLAAVQNPLLW